MKLTPRQKYLGPPSKVPGQYYVRSTERGLVLSTWPKKRGGKKTPAQAYKEAEFGMAARFAANPDPEQLDSAIVAAEGTTMVPRDFLTADCYGTLWTFQFADGTFWTRYRDVTINAQLVLDQVTDDTPAVMWRAPIGWVGTQPGAVGDVLTWNGVEILWQNLIPPPTPYDAGSGSPQLPYWTDATMYLGPPSVGGAASSTNTRQAGHVVYVPCIVPYNRTFTSIAIRVPVGGNVVGSSVRLGIYLADLTSGGPGVRVLDAGTISTATVGLKAITINQALARGVYWVALHTSAAINVQALSQTFALAVCGYSLGAAVPAPSNYLDQTLAFASGLPTTLVGVTLTPGTAITPVPVIGIR